MANYSDVQRAFVTFEAVIALLNQLRTELESETYGEEPAKWFSTSDGNKPWNFHVDWLGVTYRLAVSADVDTEQGKFILKNAKLTVSRLSDASLQNSSISTISEAIINMRDGSIHFGKGEVREHGEKLYPHHHASDLFLAMIGQPVEF